MHTVDAIHSRRSIRAYQDRPVDRHMIEEIVWDAAQAPTPPVSGDEPFTFIVVEGAERVALFGMQALQYVRETRPPGPGYDWLDRDDFSVFFNAPAVIVICAQADEGGQAAQDCSRAGQNLMLSAQARGLGTCWVGSPMDWLRDPDTKARLAIPENLTPFAAFTLGYPQGTPTGHPRDRPPTIWAP
ncbi:MAG: nitroreductase family protein [Acidobacteria bacterium]|nr:nitroreductase family protein [Acidobacteriota bacterium]